MSKTQLFKYLKGAQALGDRFFRNLKIQFPKINIEWLITGIGAPVVDVDGEKNNKVDQIHFMENTGTKETPTVLNKIRFEFKIPEDNK